METAKWILSCFPETAPKKAQEDKSSGGASITQVNNMTFNLDKFRHIAEGVKKFEKAQLQISGKDELVPIYRKGGNKNGTTADKVGNEYFEISDAE
jgi:hypothetical protein